MSYMRAIPAVCAVTCTLFTFGAAPSPLYTAVEVDRFSAPQNVAFPVDAQSALVDEIAREISVESPTVLIVRQGEAAPDRHAVLRVSGVVTHYDPGNTAKRRIGFGGPAIAALVTFLDASTGKVLLNRELEARAGDSLAKKIAKACNAAHLIASN